MKDLTLECDALLGRLERLTAEGLVHPSWVQNLDKYGLLYEVTMSSGMTLKDIHDLDDDEFLDAVGQGMLEWDL